MYRKKKFTTRMSDKQSFLKVCLELNNLTYKKICDPIKCGQETWHFSKG